MSFITGPNEGVSPSMRDENSDTHSESHHTHPSRLNPTEHAPTTPTHLRLHRWVHSFSEAVRARVSIECSLNTRQITRSYPLVFIHKIWNKISSFACSVSDSVTVIDLKWAYGEPDDFERILVLRLCFHCP